MTGSLLLGIALSVLIAATGYWRRALTPGGAVGAVLIGSLVFGLGGWTWGLLLITFFVSSSWLSHYRRAEKEPAAIKFAKGSRRDLGQVLANGGLGAVLAVTYARYPDPLLLAAFVGAMAAVNADTWATELGVLSRTPPRLITTGQPTEPGASGGVNSLGLWASVVGALLIGAAATALAQAVSLLSGHGWSREALALSLVGLVGGLSGSLFDSLLGATVQGVYYCDACAQETESAVHRCGRPARPLRGWPWLNNDLVNLTASLVGGLIAAALAWILWK